MPRAASMSCGELVEEHLAQRALVARVAREHRALDRLGQIDQAEDRQVGVGEPRLELRALLGVEKLRGRS